MVSFWTPQVQAPVGFHRVTTVLKIPNFNEVWTTPGREPGFSKGPDVRSIRCVKQPVFQEPVFQRNNKQHSELGLTIDIKPKELGKMKQNRSIQTWMSWLDYPVPGAPLVYLFLSIM